MDVSDQRWEEDYFLAQRAGVLKEWPTGNEVDLEEALQYHKALPDHRVQAKQLARAKAEGGIMILPQLGQALMPTMLEFIRFVEGQCGMSDWNDSWFLILDAYSRKKRFDAVDKLVHFELIERVDVRLNDGAFTKVGPPAGLWYGRRPPRM